MALFKHVFAGVFMLAIPSMAFAVPLYTTDLRSPAGFTVPQSAQRNADSQQEVQHKNDVLLLAAKQPPVDTTVNTEQRQITFLPSGQVSSIVLTQSSVPRVSYEYSYFSNGDIQTIAKSELFIVHGTPFKGVTTENYGHDVKGRSVLLSISGTDTNGITTIGASYSYQYTSANKRTFTAQLAGGGLTSGVDFFNGQGQIVEHAQNTTFNGVFDPLFESVTRFTYCPNGVTENVFQPRLVHGKQLTAREVIARNLPPNEINKYSIIQKTRIIQTANFYFYDNNGAHLIVTRYAYQ